MIPESKGRKTSKPERERKHDEQNLVVQISEGRQNDHGLVADTSQQIRRTS